MSPKQTRSAPACALLLVCLFAAQAGAQQPQQPCQQPAVSAAARAQSIFSPRQEMDLGDVIAEHVQQDYRVVEDPEVTGFLRRVGERLVSQLPPSEMRYQFFVVDLPDANAFTMPGGRIYVTRKLIAFAASEDELAGVLAHELGHAASGQMGAEMTRLFREVLGATGVTDRRDIFEKYNQILDNAARKPGAWKRGDREEEGQQYEADRIGIYAMAAAGYDPQAFVSMWNRLTDVKGKTGGWLSDLFGTTRPESRRLREILKGVSTLPAQCVAARPAATPEEFKRWQAAVVSRAASAAREESLHAVLSKTKLDPPLRGDINYLRFSPDGRYILSQDDSGIDLVTREPLAHFLHIDAPEAMPAQFTPDSKGLVFYNHDLRVEEWDVEAKKLRAAKELYARDGCIQTALAPDGRTLACLDGKFALALYDVEKGEPFFAKKDFYKPDLNDIWRLIFYQLFADEGNEFDWVSMAFSPDAHYFAAGQTALTFNALGASNQLSTVAFDLTTRAPVQLNDNVKRLIGNRFVFLGPDRILGLHTQDSKKSGVVTFPAGQVVEQFPLAGRLAPVTRGDYVLISGLLNQSGPRMSVLVFDLKTKKFVRGSRTPAVDVYDRWTIGERINGELALYDMEKNEALGTVQLPRSPLGRLRVTAVSPDLKWLAVSERSRGAVWDLSKGSRLFHTRGFRAADFAQGGVYVDFPKYEEAERSVARLDLASGQAFEHRKLGDTPVWQRGGYSVLRKPLKKDGGLDANVTLSVSDAVTGAAMWSRDFQKEAPRVFVDEYAGTMVFSWSVKSDHAKSEIKADPKLKERLAAMGEKEGDYFIQTVDAKTGQPVSTLLVETGKGSFRIDDMFAAGDWLVVSDTSKRVLLYSLATGEQKGKFFGREPAISPAAGLLSVETERGQLTLFDLATGERRDRFDFAAPVSLAHFSEDGKRLLVLTADQTVYVLDLTAK
jgi:WD40 repeat protein